MTSFGKLSALVGTLAIVSGALIVGLVVHAQTREFSEEDILRVDNAVLETELAARERELIELRIKALNLELRYSTAELARAKAVESSANASLTNVLNSLISNHGYKPGELEYDRSKKKLVPVQ